MKNWEAIKERIARCESAEEFQKEIQKIEGCEYCSYNYNVHGCVPADSCEIGVSKYLNKEVEK